MPSPVRLFVAGIATKSLFSTESLKDLPGVELLRRRYLVQPLGLRALGRFTWEGEAGVAVRSVKCEDMCLRACCLGLGVHCSAFQ